MLIAIAKRAGVRTINVVRRSEQKEELLALGCAYPRRLPRARLPPCMHQPCALACVQQCLGSDGLPAVPPAMAPGRGVHPCLGSFRDSFSSALLSRVG